MNQGLQQNTPMPGMYNYGQYQAAAYRPNTLGQVAGLNIPQQPQAFLKGRPVASIDEVRATTIDFDGSVFFFPDLANKKIYTKQINIDGTSSLNMYELKNIPVQVAPEGASYITREEFEGTIDQIKQYLSGLQINRPAAEEPKVAKQATDGPVFNFQ